MSEPKFKKGDHVVVIDEKLKNIFPDIYVVDKIKECYDRDANKEFLYILKNEASGEICRTSFGSNVCEKWIDFAKV